MKTLSVFSGNRLSFEVCILQADIEGFEKMSTPEKMDFLGMPGFEKRKVLIFKIS